MREEERNTRESSESLGGRHYVTLPPLTAAQLNNRLGSCSDYVHKLTVQRYLTAAISKLVAEQTKFGMDADQ